MVDTKKIKNMIQNMKMIKIVLKFQKFDPKPVNRAFFIRILKNRIRLSCGEMHTAVVTENGAVFTWGCGQNGRLGRRKM